MGPGSQVTPQGTSARVSGAWRLGCGAGASFDRTVATGVSPAPSASAVLTPMSSAAAACFDASCALPEGMCVRAAGGAIAVLGCADGQPPTDGMWRNPPRVPAGAVFVGGRLIGSQVHSSAAPVPSSSSGSSLQGSASQPPPVARAPTSAAPPTAGAQVAVPSPPPDPCVPNPALREPSNAQVDAGNSAVVAGDLDEALDRYRAAISINQCNAFAWTALGDALLQTGHPEPARAALVVATRLMPTHFHAWTTLGQAEERAGDRGAARRAYQQALSAKPGHPPAAAGLSRVGG